MFLMMRISTKSQKILNKSYDEEVTERIYLKMKHATGELRWVYWSFTISPKDKLYYCIGRDVTTEKLAEEQTILQQKQLKLAELFAREAIESKNYFMKKNEPPIKKFTYRYPWLFANG